MLFSDCVPNEYVPELVQVELLPFRYINGDVGGATGLPDESINSLRLL